MSSAEFLILQAFLIAVTIVIGRRMARSPLPALDLPKVPERPDAYALAWLTGGDAGVVRLATFDLVRHGYVAVGVDGQVRPQLPPADAAAIDPVAKGVYQTLTGPLKADGYFFKRLDRFQSFRSVVDGYREHWTRLGLAAEPELVKRSWLIAAGMLAVTFVIDGARLVDAFDHDLHNVIFIVLLGAVSIVPMLLLVPIGRVTPLGKRFLAQVRMAHALVKENVARWSRQDQRGAAGDAMLLSVAVLGTATLVGTPWSRMQEAFSRSDRTGGGGCSSGSSCGSGSSCSGGNGGSGCGSGCGGGGGD